MLHCFYLLEHVLLNYVAMARVHPESSLNNPLSNGVIIVSIYLNQVAGSKPPDIEHTSFKVVKQDSLYSVYPLTPFLDSSIRFNGTFLLL